MSKRPVAAVLAHDRPRTSATVDHFGRILIPKAIREAAGLREGTEVDFIAEGNHLQLVPHLEAPLVQRRDGVPVIVGQVLGDVSDVVERHRHERLRKLGGR